MMTTMMAKRLVQRFILLSALILIGACSDNQQIRKEMQAALSGQAENKQIIEFFIYTCPHCKALEPSILDWQAKQGILFQQGIYSFEQIPVVFAANWLRDSKVGEKEAQLFYTLRRMGLEPRLRAALFTAIQDKSLDLTSQESLALFLQTHGVAVSEFNATLQSALVRADVERAEKLTQQYAVRAVPAMVFFNRLVLMPQDYADQAQVQAALLATVKDHYLKNTNK